MKESWKYIFGDLSEIYKIIDENGKNIQKVSYKYSHQMNIFLEH